MLKFYDVSGIKIACWTQKEHFDPRKNLFLYTVPAATTVCGPINTAGFVKTSMLPLLTFRDMPNPVVQAKRMSAATVTGYERS